MATPFVTALIDTYNHESFIADAIESVLAQDFPASEIEIIVVDDGSVDRTPDVVRKFAPRVRLLRKRNGGQASAFNAGIAESAGAITAFLDGDDWWVPAKLTAVANAFHSDEAVGVVGHGLTQVNPDGSHRVETPREMLRFRVDSVGAARKFRLCRGFLGTSRMAFRKEVLRQIGTVPEELKFEADEYLFSLGPILSDVMILPEPLTFYRLHGGNLFQMAKGDEGMRRKQRVLSALSAILREQLPQRGVSQDVAKIIAECVQVEAELLRLGLENGFPWETLSVERKVIEIFLSDASPWQRLFSYMRLAPVLVMPSAAYYRWRRRLSSLEFYRRLRERFMPYPVPKHVHRQDKPVAR
jgi:Glycosyl transferase family 2